MHVAMRDLQVGQKMQCVESGDDLTTPATVGVTSPTSCVPRVLQLTMLSAAEQHECNMPVRLHAQQAP
jgi:hypothetical protein